MSEAPIPTNLPEYSVSELSQALKRDIETKFSHVRVRGEISGFKRHSSGHLYLALKDAEAVIDAVCWRGTSGRIAVKPEDGMEVVCTGRLTTYPGRSKYQLIIESMELAGVGALLKLLEDRKQRLAAEGLFDEGRKQKLPFLPRVIGVVTSPTGAVIRDILHRLNDRFPTRVLLWPVAVQGEGAAVQIAAAIEGFNLLPEDGDIPRPDLLIVARGGGSLEDLMAFNEEIVVRAVASSAIPLISAVGHETDTTLIDYASDRRAPTPTAAAEIAVPVRLELLGAVAALGGRLTNGLARLFAERRVRLEGLARGLPDPHSILGQKAQLLDDRAERLDFAVKTRLEGLRARLNSQGAHLKHPRQQIGEARARLVTAAQILDSAFGHFVSLKRQRIGDTGGRLRAELLSRFLRHETQRFDGIRSRFDSLSPKKVLERGYALIHDAAGKIITAAKSLPPGTAFTVEFHDGEVAAVAGSGSGRSTQPKRVREKKPEQGTLL